MGVGFGEGEGPLLKRGPSPSPKACPTPEIGFLNARVGEEMGGGVFHDNAPKLQHIPSGRQFERGAGVLFHNKNGHAGLVDGADRLEDGLHEQGGEAERRLIQQQQLGWPMSARPMASICCSPPESVPAS